MIRFPLGASSALGCGASLSARRNWGLTAHLSIQISWWSRRHLPTPRQLLYEDLLNLRTAIALTEAA